MTPGAQTDAYVPPAKPSLSNLTKEFGKINVTGNEVWILILEVLYGYIELYWPDFLFFIHS